MEEQHDLSQYTLDSPESINKESTYTKKARFIDIALSFTAAYLLAYVIGSKYFFLYTSSVFASGEESYHWLITIIHAPVYLGILLAGILQSESIAYFFGFGAATVILVFWFFVFYTISFVLRKFVLKFNIFVRHIPSFVLVIILVSPVFFNVPLTSEGVGKNIPLSGNVNFENCFRENRANDEEADICFDINFGDYIHIHKLSTSIELLNLCTPLSDSKKVSKPLLNERYADLTHQEFCIYKAFKEVSEHFNPWQMLKLDEYKSDIAEKIYNESAEALKESSLPEHLMHYSAPEYNNEALQEFAIKKKEAKKIFCEQVGSIFESHIKADTCLTYVDDPRYLSETVTEWQDYSAGEAIIILDSSSTLKHGDVILGEEIVLEASKQNTPSWLTTTIPTTNKPDIIAFDVQYATNREATLSVQVNSEFVHTCYSNYKCASGEKLKQASFLPKNISGNNMSLSFRLDGLGDEVTIVKISNIHFGFLDGDGETDEINPTNEKPVFLPDNYINNLQESESLISEDNWAYAKAVREGTNNKDISYCNKITDKQYNKWDGVHSDYSWKSAEELQDLCVYWINQNIQNQ